MLDWKRCKILLTKFDLEEQNIDMKYTEDSSNVETLSIFHFLDPYLSGFQL